VNLPILTLVAAIALSGGATVLHAAPPAALGPFLEDNCITCHDAETKKGGLDLDALPFSPEDPKAFAEWVKVYDRIADREMPPKNKKQPALADTRAFLQTLAAPLKPRKAARAGGV